MVHLRPFMGQSNHYFKNYGYFCADNQTILCVSKAPKSPKNITLTAIFIVFQVKTVCKRITPLEPYVWGFIWDISLENWSIFEVRMKFFLETTTIQRISMMRQIGRKEWLFSNRHHSVNLIYFALILFSLHSSLQIFTFRHLTCWEIPILTQVITFY